MININLLQETERRDPGVMVLRTTWWTLSGVAIAALALYGLHAFITLQEAQLRKKRAEAQWESLRSDFRRYEVTHDKLNAITAVAANLAAFSNAQVNVSTRLLALAAAIPPQVQLTEVALRHTNTEDESGMARQFELRLAGRVAAENSDAAVKAIIAALQAVEPPNEFGTVEPGGIRVDPQSLGSLANIFEIRCKFAPRRY